MKIFMGENHSCGLNYQFYELSYYLHDYLTKDVKDADVIIIPGTCVCTGKMLLRTISYIDNICSQNKKASKYLTGCIAREFKDDKISTKLNKYFNDKQIKVFSNLDTGNLLKEILKEQYDHQTYDFGFYDFSDDDAIMFISTGCMNNCSFCKSTYQKLQLKSSELDQLKQFVDYLDEKNIPNLIVRGTNISQYGYDLYDEYKLPELIEYIESKNSIKKVNLVGFGFKEAIHNDFKKVLRCCKKYYEISGSLESGSDRLLELMNKGFTSEEFVDFIQDLDNMYFSLNIIAGFPTESIEDVMMTLNVLNQVKNGDVYICRYTNSNLVDSNKYEKLSPSVVQNHARIYQKTLKNRNVKCSIKGYDYI